MAKSESETEVLVNCGCGLCLIVIGVCAAVTAVVWTYRYVCNP